MSEVKANNSQVELLIMAEPRLITKLMAEQGISRSEAQAILDNFLKRHI